MIGESLSLLRITSGKILAFKSCKKLGGKTANEAINLCKILIFQTQFTEEV